MANPSPSGKRSTVAPVERTSSTLWKTCRFRASKPAAGGRSRHVNRRIRFEYSLDFLQ